MLFLSPSSYFMSIASVISLYRSYCFLLMLVLPCSLSCVLFVSSRIDDLVITLFYDSHSDDNFGLFFIVRTIIWIQK